MSVPAYTSLNDVREAIRLRRIIRFTYRKKQITVEPYLLGRARRTQAFVIYAWCLGPEEGWEHFRYAEMRNLEFLDTGFDVIRSGFNPYDSKLAGIDTCIGTKHP